jgi:hypothetical protein
MIKMLIIAGYLGLTGVSAQIFWRFRQASPAFWLSMTLAPMAIGTFVLRDPRLASDPVFITMFLLAGLAWLVRSSTYGGPPYRKGALGSDKDSRIMRCGLPEFRRAS